MAHWQVDRIGAVAVCTFSRPPRNLMSMAAMSELEGLLTSLAGDDSVGVVMLTGGVAGYFIAHADLDDLAALGRGEPVEGDPGSWARTTALMEAMPQPVIAAVNGQAWGGGCEISLACTLRVAAASAHFSQPEVAVGIIPGAGGTQRLPRLIGPGFAAELVLTGRVVESAEALRIGLVNAVLPDDDFVDEALDWVAPMLRHPRHAIVAAKRALVDGRSLPLDEALQLESRLFLECQLRPGTADLQAQVAIAEHAAPPNERFNL